MFGWLRSAARRRPDSRRRLAGHAGALSLSGRAAGGRRWSACARWRREFLRDKEFHGAQGFVITDEVALAIAAQAVLPVLHLQGGLDWYDDFVGIVVHPAEVVARRKTTDEAGVVHEYDEVVAGEAMDRGPVMLSWQDVLREQRHRATQGYNVVIHEFAHKIDMRDGAADGCPPLPAGFAGTPRRATRAPPGSRCCSRPTTPSARRPSWPSASAARRPGSTPTARESIGEFFAVACEAYFVNRARFARGVRRHWCALFDEFFQRRSAERDRPARLPLLAQQGLQRVLQAARRLPRRARRPAPCRRPAPQVCAGAGSPRRVSSLQLQRTARIELLGRRRHFGRHLQAQQRLGRIAGRGAAPTAPATRRRARPATRHGRVPARWAAARRRAAPRRRAAGSAPRRGPAPRACAARTAACSSASRCARNAASPRRGPRSSKRGGRSPKRPPPSAAAVAAAVVAAPAAAAAAAVAAVAELAAAARRRGLGLLAAGTVVAAHGDHRLGRGLRRRSRCRRGGLGIAARRRIGAIGRRDQVGVGGLGGASRRRRFGIARRGACSALSANSAAAWPGATTSVAPTAGRRRPAGAAGAGPGFAAQRGFELRRWRRGSSAHRRWHWRLPAPWRRPARCGRARSWPPAAFSRSARLAVEGLVDRRAERVPQLLFVAAIQRHASAPRPASAAAAP